MLYPGSINIFGKPYCETTIENRLNFLQKQIYELSYALHGLNWFRPPCSGRFYPAYKAWLESLPEEQRAAENELRRKGYYNYEGDTEMLVRDSLGKDIHTEDVVVWQGQDCVVVCILSEEEIQVNPLGEGLPELVRPADVQVKHSFIDKLRSLRTNEELLEIIGAAERRLATSRTSETRTEGPKKVAKKTVMEIEL